MICCTAVLPLFSAGLFALSAPNEPLSAREALSRWERFGKEIGYEELTSVVDTVEGGTERGDSEAFRRLMGILKSEVQGPPSRGEAAVLACTIADAEDTPVLLEIMHKLRRGRKPDGGDAPVSQEVYESNALLVGHFVGDGAEHLLGVMPEDDLLLTFVKEVYLWGYARDKRRKCVDLMTRCNVAAEVRRDTVLEIISHVRIRGTAAPEALLDWLDASAFPELRRLVRAEQTLERFHFAAADALSYHGDQKIVADLEALKPVFRAEHPNVEAHLTRFIWRIEVQHPTSKLLEYIASPELSQPGKYRRIWAVKRAHTLGLETEAIREAILQYANHAQTQGERIELPVLKKVGLRLGILQEADLPDVKTRRSRAKP